MNGNLNMMLLLAMMMAFILPGLVVVQIHETFAPSVHNHPPHSQLLSHFLSSFPTFYLSHPQVDSPPPLDKFERLSTAKCIITCGSTGCYKLHGSIPKIFAYCFGNCAKEVCGSDN